MKRFASLCLLLFLSALGKPSLLAVTFEAGANRLPIGDIASVKADATNRVRFVFVYVGVELKDQYESGLFADRYWIENDARIYFYNMGAPMTAYPYNAGVDGDLGTFADAKIRDHIKYRMEFDRHYGETFVRLNDPLFLYRRFLVLVGTTGNSEETLDGTYMAPQYFFSGHLFRLEDMGGSSGYQIPESAYHAPEFLFGTDWFSRDIRNLRIPVRVPYATEIKGVAYPIGQTYGGKAYDFFITPMKDPRENFAWMPYDFIAKPDTNRYGTLTVRYDKDIECIKETFDIIMGQKVCPQELRVGLGRANERTLLCVTGPKAPLIRLEASDDLKTWSTFSVIADFNGLTWTLPPGLSAPTESPHKFFRAVAP